MKSDRIIDIDGGREAQNILMRVCSLEVFSRKGLMSHIVGRMIDSSYTVLFFLIPSQNVSFSFVEKSTLILSN